LYYKFVTLACLHHNIIKHVGSVTTICVRVGKYNRLNYLEGKEVSNLQFHWIRNRGSHLAP
ncbi:MAG: hypothetical protein WB053_13935, partial [Nitrososphaeraceae archaeon]